MNLSQQLPDLTEVPEAFIDEAIWDTFNSWTASKGINLYPAQEEASLGILAGDNVILATPTGSGKSMVANAAHFIALARGQRSFYTAPIKALVSEKFFALCEIFGAENVGMMTGDATVNGNAPIIAATAEIVANIALRDGAAAAIDQVVMDEFHYYSDPDRGWAWQVPLLELPKAQFLLMSATLGDTDWLQEDLTRRTGRETDLVAGSTRPVPLDFSYVFSAVHETIEELLADKKAPIYVVHFSQREAAERAQALTSLSSIISTKEKESIAEEIGSFRFTTAFGKDLSKLLRKGIGVHHAGMLPKYRRLVERLAQRGLLKVICGTDTLGVGINVPIRTVLMTGLAKFDGQRQRILKSREFHQIAGRAGRAGYDTEGTVVVEAPEHEIENAKARRRIGDDPKRLKKLKKKSAREGEVSWSEKTFARLTQAEPEQLTSQFRVSNSMLLNVLARHGDGYAHMRQLLRDNHDPRSKQNKHILTALDLFRGLVDSGVVQKSTKGLDIYGRPYHLVRELPRDFALNQPLGPFALAALSLLDPETDSYHLDVISVFEAILDDPRQVLQAQQKKRRGEEIAALKADGVDYTDRMNIVEDITWPKPLEELLEQAYDTFAETNAWIKEFELRPKSVVRHMVENAMTFSDLVSTYGLSRSEGVILRYLTDAWRTLKQSIPDEYTTPHIEDIIVWLGELIRQVDSSLVDEWAQMAGDDSPIDQDTLDRELAFGVEDPTALTANRRAFGITVRNYMFRLTQLFAREEEDHLAAVLDYLDQVPDFGAILDDYFDEYDDIDTGPEARGPEYFQLKESNSRSWPVRQILKDPAGDRAYHFVAIVDLDASDQAGEVRLSEFHVEY
ncbi:DEAD/DEAH box helicase [Corynebacterium macginleyi]|uniref:DEAD/DEAH box helicase n=1 Tax=Corynebacterium macginleyi TaxID=38290 RepID=UPI00308096BC